MFKFSFFSISSGKKFCLSVILSWLKKEKNCSKSFKSNKNKLLNFDTEGSMFPGSAASIKKIGFCFLTVKIFLIKFLEKTFLPFLNPIKKISYFLKSSRNLTSSTIFFNFSSKK